MNGPALAVSAVVVDDDRILMVRRGHGRAAGAWAPPGGRVATGETLMEAVVRELREETGIEGFCGALIGLSELLPDSDLDPEPDPGPTAHVVIATYRVDLLESVEPTAGGDAAEARWVPLVDLAELRLAPGVAEFLHDHGIITIFT